AAASATVRLAIVAIPVCTTQAVIAEPLFAVLFNEKFSAAWPIYAVFNLAMMFRLMNPLAANLIQAQGRFRAYFLTHLSSATVFLAAIATGWILGDLIGVAWGVVAHSAVAMVLFFSVAFGMREGAMRVVLRAVVVPLAAGAIGAASGFAAMSVVAGEGMTTDIGRCVAGALCFGIGYGAAVWLLDRTTIRSIVTELAGMLPGRRHPPASPTPAEADR
ncbi:MAG: hypothetical protein AAFY46_12550, partial [Planctomycetota bacterium]